MITHINHPPHYTAHRSGLECIDITERLSFTMGNAVKYVWRADEKGSPLDDLRKAAWYLRREAERKHTRPLRLVHGSHNETVALLCRVQGVDSGLLGAVVGCLVHGLMKGSCMARVATAMLRHVEREIERREGVEVAP